MTMENSSKMCIEQVAELSDRVIQEVEKAVVGKHEVLSLMLAAFLSSGGHILLEDYPGLTKTLIANSFARALGMEFKRIQFTPLLAGMAGMREDYPASSPSRLHPSVWLGANSIKETVFRAPAPPPGNL